MRWRRWGFVLGAVILLLCVVVGVLAFIFMDLLVDFWWFSSLHYTGYFWQRLIYRYMVFAGATALFFLIFFLNFWIASRYLGTTEPPRSVKGTAAWKDYRELIKMFRTGSMQLYTPLSLVLAILLAYPLYQQWEQTLLFLLGPLSGVPDPAYGHDISFYLFALPIYDLLANRLILTFLVLLASLVALYFLENRMVSSREFSFPRGARIHLSIMVLFLFLLGAWKLLLQRHMLLYVDTHQPLFHGPGYIEMKLTLPLIWLSLVLLLATGVSLTWLINDRSKRAAIVTAVLAACFAGALGLRYSRTLPNLTERYIVKPNEIAAEKPYIAMNIEGTLSAYNLKNVESREYPVPEIPWDSTAPDVRMSLRNIPVWDGDQLITVFEQLQEIRTYYNFPSVDVDRYPVNNVYQQVFLGAREISLAALPEGAKNWINTHLKYTHGIGAVMIPAAQGGEEPMTWFMQDIPPSSDFGIRTLLPAIYFGQGSFQYVIAPNEAHEFGYPVADTAKLVDYEGEGGVHLDIFRKFIFALYFKDRNIFFTTFTNNKSRILFRQNITERITRLTPFFALDRDPYLVVTPDRLYWIQDAYTTSEWYPYSQPFKDRINYIRNSVKIIIDAYNGTVNYYISDPDDPIIRAYNRIYPGLLKNMLQMPSYLKPHVRYPKDIFEAQLGIFNKYHQTDPETFYKQEDVWEFPKLQRMASHIPSSMMPFYMTLNLISEDRFEFMQINAVTPLGRDNLRALVVAGCDGPNYGRLIFYNFPKGQLIYGPSQIDALIDQDTLISQQFTLWNQAGSEVERGRMIVLPIGHAVVYIQPVYMRAATRLKIPELKRLIVSQGDSVVMAMSLEDAFAQLATIIGEKNERVRRRLQELQPPTEPPSVTTPPVVIPPPAATPPGVMPPPVTAPPAAAPPPGD